MNIEKIVTELTARVDSLTDEQAAQRALVRELRRILSEHRTDLDQLLYVDTNEEWDAW